MNACSPVFSFIIMINCSSLMVALHFGLNVFHKKQHQDFVSILQSMQNDQYRPLREQDIQLRGIPFSFVYHYRSLVCKLNANQTVCEISLWCLQQRKLPFFLP